MIPICSFFNLLSGWFLKVTSYLAAISLYVSFCPAAWRWELQMLPSARCERHWKSRKKQSCLSVAFCCFGWSLLCVAIVVAVQACWVCVNILYNDDNSKRRREKDKTCVCRKNGRLRIDEKRKTEPWLKVLIIDWRRYRWGYRLLRNLCMQR